MSSDAVVQLVIVKSNGEEKIVKLYDGQTIAVGRDPNNELFLDDNAVSRVHACFTVTMHGVVLADLSSRNGTFLNGERISSFCDLTDGDLINIGSTKIKVEFEFGEEEEEIGENKDFSVMTTEVNNSSVIVLLTSLNDNSINENEFSYWYKEVNKIVEQYGGKLDKRLNSSLVVLWIGDEFQELVKCAGLACEKLLKIKDVNDKYYSSTIILTSGTAFNSISDKKSTFMLLGDPVNIAFKLEKVLEKIDGRFLMDKVLAEQACEHYKLERLVGVRLRDGDAPTDVYLVKGFKE